MNTKVTEKSFVVFYGGFVFAAAFLPLEQINRLANIMYAEILGQRWMLPSHGFIHRVSHFAV